MTQQARDPYPESLDDIPFAPEPFGSALPPHEPPKEFGTAPTSGIGGQYLAALNRIATALERLSGLQPAQNALQQPRANLTPLPPVQTVSDRPACPYHGADKVAPSKKGPGFYCQAQGGPQANARGYCGWHS